MSIFFSIFWNNSWANKDHIAQRMMDKKDFVSAFKAFERKDWKAVAAYRAGMYNKAEQLFKTLNTPDGYYNQGNALALQGKYEQAIKAYTQALQLNPKHADAIYNRNLVQKLLKKSQNQSKKEQNPPKPDQDQDKDQDQKSKEQESNQDQQNQPQKLDTDNKKLEPLKSEQETQQEKQPQPIKSPEQQEKDHAKEQWLSVIPDDPGAFLREKFLRDHLRRKARH
jgi:Ca-activated chloride channel homolog